MSPQNPETPWLENIDGKVYAELRANRHTKALTAFELSERTDLTIDAVAASLQRMLGEGFVIDCGGNQCHRFTLSARAASVADASGPKAKPTETVAEATDAQVEATANRGWVDAHGNAIRAKHYVRDDQALLQAKAAAIAEHGSLEGREFYTWDAETGGYVLAD